MKQIYKYYERFSHVDHRVVIVIYVEGRANSIYSTACMLQMCINEESTCNKCPLFRDLCKKVNG